MQLKEIIRLRQEINRLWSKGMSNIYLKVTIETLSKLRFCRFKKRVTRSVFVELQLTQISLNFKTSCCNLGANFLGAKLLGSKTVCGFSIILILKGIIMF